MLHTHSHILALFLTPRFVYIGITINSCNLLHNTQQERTYILAKPDPRTHVCLCLHICSLPHEPAIHLFLYAENSPWRPAPSSTWLAGGWHVIWEPERLSGAAVRAIRICIGIGLNGLMCRLNLCTRQSLDGTQGGWESCNISGLRPTWKIALLHFSFEIWGFWWHHLAPNLLWPALLIARWFVRRLSCDPCPDENNARICVFPHANSTQITSCRSCWHCSCCWRRSERNCSFRRAATEER